MISSSIRIRFRFDYLISISRWSIRLILSFINFRWIIRLILSFINFDFDFKIKDSFFIYFIYIYELPYIHIQFGYIYMYVECRCTCSGSGNRHMFSQILISSYIYILLFPMLLFFDYIYSFMVHIYSTVS